jgi:hypothetical protein
VHFDRFRYAGSCKQARPNSGATYLAFSVGGWGYLNFAWS